MLCVCVSGDGGELLQQDILTQRGQRHVLPHVQADGADLEGGQGDRGGVSHTCDTFRCETDLLTG